MKNKVPKTKNTKNNKYNIVLRSVVASSNYALAVEVIVLKTRQDMIDFNANYAYPGQTFSERDDTVSATFRRTEVEKPVMIANSRGRDCLLLGCIALNLENLTYSTIMHECFHAAIQWEYYVKMYNCALTTSFHEEELFVRFFDDLYANILAALFRHKLVIKNREYDERTELTTDKEQFLGNLRYDTKSRQQ